MSAKAITIARRWRISSLLAGILLLALSAPSIADICSQLKGQLASLPRQGATGGGTNTSGELQKLKTQAKWGGCVYGGPGFFVTQKSRDCPRILARINQLEGGKRKSAARADPQIEAKRASLSQALRTNGCNARTPPKQSVAGGGVQRHGSYRSLCVRTCDGYYFPIGYATSRNLLKIEEAACKSMYFGRDAELYAHGTGGQMEEAVSLKEERYANKPFAFQYRERFDARCVAQIRSGMSGLARVMPASKIVKRVEPAPARPRADFVSETIPPPSLRPSRSAEDPETAANAKGNFGRTFETFRAMAMDADIRKLGPAYYYAPTPDPAPFAKAFIEDRDLPPFTSVEPVQAAELNFGTETARRRDGF